MSATTVTALRRENATLRNLLREAYHAIDSELYATGSDEWPKHPELVAKAKLCDRIDKALHHAPSAPPREAKP